MQIVHRDVSPQNVLVSYGGDVKLCDFGIAKAENRLTETQAGEFKGKFSYMSPEQFGQGSLDHRSDIFALGILLYETTVGTRLFRADSSYETMRRITEGEIESPRAIRSDYPAQFEQITMKALALKPEDRFSSAQAMEQALQDWLFDQRVRVGPRQLGGYLRGLDVAPRERHEPEMAAETTNERHPAIGAEDDEDGSTVEVDPTVQIDLSLGDLIAMEEERLEQERSQEEVIDPTVQIDLSEDRLEAMERGERVAPEVRVERVEEGQSPVEGAITDEYDEGAPTAVVSREATMIEELPEETTSPMDVDDEVARSSEALWQGSQEPIEFEDDSEVEALELDDLEAMTIDEGEELRLEREEPQEEDDPPVSRRKEASVRRTEALPSIERPRPAAAGDNEMPLKRMGIVGGSAALAIAVGLALVWAMSGSGDEEGPEPEVGVEAMVGEQMEVGALTELEGGEPGPVQEHRLETEPAGATAVVNGVLVESKTPTSVELRQGATNEVWVMKPGYGPAMRRGGGEALEEPVVLERQLPEERRPLEVISEPAGAWVMIDGQEAGRTPLRYENAPVGRPIHLQMERSGFEPAVAWLNLEGVNRDRVALPLMPEGEEQVAAEYDLEPSGSQIRLDGQRLGQTPHRISHRKGEWLALEIGDEAGAMYERSLDLTAVGSFYLGGMIGAN